MDSVVDGLISSTVFTPGVAPANCASAYMRNCSGAGTNPDVPTTVAAGHYQVVIPGNLDEQRISVNARAYATNSPNNRRVTVVFTNALGGNCTLDIYVRDDAGALSEDFLNCEVSISRLPI